MASSHHDLVAFVGVTLVLLVRFLYSRFFHRRQRLNLPDHDDAKTPRDGETESLLPRRLTTAVSEPLAGRPLFIRGCIIGIAATGYMAIAIYGKHVNDISAVADSLNFRITFQCQ